MISATDGDANRERLLDFLVGRNLGPYLLHERLGAGGMGVVYRAVHQGLDAPRAVKILPTNLADDTTFVARFEREARLAARLRHPNIVQVHDVGRDSGLHFIAMELLEGRTLRQVILDDRPIAVERALRLLEQLVAALSFAHQHGIAHRDIKPGNVFVGPVAPSASPSLRASQEHVTLVDFGIARAAEESSLTGTGGIIGTAEYMAPEIVNGDGSGESGDLYALGIVAYELLTGRVPFAGLNSRAIMHAQVSQEPPRLRSIRPDLAVDLEAVVLRQIAKSPSDRFASAEAFLVALQAAASGARRATDDGAAAPQRAVPPPTPPPATPPSAPAPPHAASPPSANREAASALNAAMLPPVSVTPPPASTPSGPSSSPAPPLTGATASTTGPTVAAPPLAGTVVPAGGGQSSNVAMPLPAPPGGSSRSRPGAGRRSRLALRLVLALLVLTVGCQGWAWLHPRFRPGRALSNADLGSLATQDSFRTAVGGGVAATAWRSDAGAVARIWRASDGRRLTELTFTRDVRQVAVSPNGRHVAVGTMLKDGDAGPAGVLVSMQGSATQDIAALYAFDIPNQAGPNERPRSWTSVGFSADSDLLAIGDSSGSITLLRTSDRSVVWRTEPLPQDGPIAPPWAAALTISPSKRLLAASVCRFVANSSTRCRLELRQIEDGRLVRQGPIPTAEEQYGAPSMLAMDPRDTMIASIGGRDRRVRLWRTSDLAQDRVVAPDESALQETLLEWFDQELVFFFHRVTGFGGVGYPFAVGVGFTPDGQAVWAGGEDGEVRTWRVSDGTLLRQVGGAAGDVSLQSLTLGGRSITDSYSSDGGVALSFRPAEVISSRPVNVQVWYAP